MMKMGEAAYKNAENTESETNESNESKNEKESEDVVDADFEEVDNEKKDK